MQMEAWELQCGGTVKAKAEVVVRRDVPTGNSAKHSPNLSDPQAAATLTFGGTCYTAISFKIRSGGQGGVYTSRRLTATSKRLR